MLFINREFKCTKWRGKSLHSSNSIFFFFFFHLCARISFYINIQFIKYPIFFFTWKYFSKDDRAFYKKKSFLLETKKREKVNSSMCETRVKNSAERKREFLFFLSLSPQFKETLAIPLRHAMCYACGCSNRGVSDSRVPLI